MGDYATLYTGDGGDPTFSEIDGFLQAHFGARAVHTDEEPWSVALPEARPSGINSTPLDVFVVVATIIAAIVAVVLFWRLIR